MSQAKSFLNRHQNVIINFFGFSLIIGGALLVLFFPDLFDFIFSKKMELKPNSRSHQQWKQSNEPLYLDIYFFNWTNPEEFSNKSSKPVLQEIGPYRFREFQEKVNVTWNDQNATVSYRKKSTFYFVPDESGGSLSDNITSLNMIALSAASRASSWNYFKRKGVSIGLTMSKQKIHITKKAGELLFDGYEDTMINIAKDMPLLDAGNIPFDRFGWFYKRNGTSDMLGDFNIHTGVGDILNIGSIQSWNFEQQTPFFEGECGKVRGSGGDFFPGQLSKSQVVSLFSPEMCRSVDLDFEEESFIHGIETYKFAGGARTVDNGTLYPENACYCNGACVPSGVLNVSSCRYGTPVFMSFPHYYKADPFYLNQIKGLKPTKEKHEFFMAFEPKTGIPFEVAARFQLNILVRPIKNVVLYENIPTVFMPVLWFEQHVQMNADISAEIGDVLTISFKGQLAGLVMIGIGLCLVIFVPLKSMIAKRFNTKQIQDASAEEPIRMDLNEKISAKNDDINLISKKYFWNNNNK